MACVRKNGGNSVSSPTPKAMIYSTAALPPSSRLFPYTTLFRSRFHRLAEHLRRARLIKARLGMREANGLEQARQDRKSTRLNSSHPSPPDAVFCLKKKTPRSCPASPARRPRDDLRLRRRCRATI